MNQRGTRFKHYSKRRLKIDSANSKKKHFASMRKRRRPKKPRKPKKRSRNLQGPRVKPHHLRRRAKSLRSQYWMCLSFRCHQFRSTIHRLETST
jgi:hypothetical protein